MIDTKYLKKCVLKMMKEQVQKRHYVRRYVDRKNYLQQYCIVTFGGYRGSGHTTASFLLNKKLTKSGFRCITVFTKEKMKESAVEAYKNDIGTINDINRTSLELIKGGALEEDPCYDVIIFDCAGLKTAKDIINLIIDQKIRLSVTGCIVVLQPKIV
jgi:hypothetical protein